MISFNFSLSLKRVALKPGSYWLSHVSGLFSTRAGIQASSRPIYGTLDKICGRTPRFLFVSSMSCCHVRPFLILFLNESPNLFRNTANLNKSPALCVHGCLRCFINSLLRRGNHSQVTLTSVFGACSEESRPSSSWSRLGPRRYIPPPGAGVPVV